MSGNCCIKTGAIVKIGPKGEWFRGDVFEFGETRWVRLSNLSRTLDPMEEDFVVRDWLSWFDQHSSARFSTLIADINDVERVK